MPRFRRPAVLPVVLAIVAGCGTPDAGTRWAGAVTLQPHRVQVSNPATPLFDSASIAVRSLWSLDLTPRVDAGGWGQPDRLVAAFGRIYLLDRQLGNVSIISTSGHLLTRFAGSGPGPGELTRPESITATDAGIAIGDGGRSTAERFDSIGRYLGTVHVPSLTMQIVPLTDGEFAVQSLQSPDAAWLRVDSTGATTPFIVDRVGGARVPPDRCVAATGAAGLVLINSCIVPMITLVDQAGQAIREFSIAAPAKQPSDAEVNVFEETARKRIAAVGLPAAKVEELVTSVVANNRYKKGVRKAVCDCGRGLIALWRQNPDEFGGGATEVYLLTTTGVYLARLRFTESFTDIAMTDGRLYATTLDSSTGTQSLIAYDITIPAAVRREARAVAAEHQLVSVP